MLRNHESLHFPCLFRYNIKCLYLTRSRFLRERAKSRAQKIIEKRGGWGRRAHQATKRGRKAERGAKTMRLFENTFEFEYKQSTSVAYQKCHLAIKNSLVQQSRVF